MTLEKGIEHYEELVREKDCRKIYPKSERWGCISEQGKVYRLSRHGYMDK